GARGVAAPLRADAAGATSDAVAAQHERLQAARVVARIAATTRAHLGARARIVRAAYGRAAACGAQLGGAAVAVNFARGRRNLIVGRNLTRRVAHHRRALALGCAEVAGRVGGAGLTRAAVRIGVAERTTADARADLPRGTVTTRAAGRIGGGA